MFPQNHKLHVPENSGGLELDTSNYSFMQPVHNFQRGRNNTVPLKERHAMFSPALVSVTHHTK